MESDLTDHEEDFGKIERLSNQPNEDDGNLSLDKRQKIFGHPN